MGEIINPPVLPLLCPHCDTERAGFEMVYSRAKPDTLDVFNTLCICPVCHKGIVVLIRDLDLLPKEFDRNSFNNARHIILDVFPKLTKLEAPEFTPPEVASFYIQSRDCLRRGHYDACVIMSRRTLEAAAKIKGAAGGGLGQKIRWLANSHAITADMAAWADEIRLSGNEAAHEDDPVGEDEASSIADFTELFLVYLFQLPGMLAERRKTRMA